MSARLELTLAQEPAAYFFAYGLLCTKYTPRHPQAHSI